MKLNVSAGDSNLEPLKLKSCAFFVWKEVHWNPSWPSNTPLLVRYPFEKISEIFAVPREIILSFNTEPYLNSWSQVFKGSDVSSLGQHVSVGSLFHLKAKATLQWDTAKHKKSGIQASHQAV